MLSNERREYYPALDGLRAISTMGICMMHVAATPTYNLSSIFFAKLIPTFRQFVFLFMMLSGFSLCCGYYEKIINNRISIVEFYKKRLKRIFPLYAILCILYFLLHPSVEALYETYLDLTLCFSFLNLQINPFGVGWFIGILFLFYLSFPFFCYIISNKYRAWISFAAALIMSLICEYKYGMTRHNFAFCAVFFLAGGIIYIYRDQLQRIAGKPGGVLLMAAGATACYALTDIHTPIMILMFTAYIVYALRPGKGVLNNPVTRFLSNISMEFYMIHAVVFLTMIDLEIMNPFASDTLSYCFMTAVIIAVSVFLSVGAKNLLSKVFKC